MFNVQCIVHRKYIFTPILRLISINIFNCIFSALSSKYFACQVHHVNGCNQQWLLSFYICIYIQVFNPVASWFGDLTTFTLSVPSLSSNSKLFTASNAKIATTDCHPIHLLLLTSWQHLNLATHLCQVHQQDNGCSKRFSGSHSCFMPSPNESLEMGNLIYLPSCKSQTEVSEKCF